MKNLKDYISESLLDDFDAVSSASTTDIKKEIKQFLKENYKNASKFKVSKNPNSDGYYEVNCNALDYVEVKNFNITSLTNEFFIFTNVKNFRCLMCLKLKTLKGAPKECEKFSCNGCIGLTTLEGAPEKVSEDFICERCHNLKSLKGAPKKCGRFRCNFCENLKSLKYSPEKVYYDFDCSRCHSLTSLEGSPKKVGSKAGGYGVYDCSNCKNLKSLKGAPEKVDFFRCAYCPNLKTLEGAPEEVSIFTCDHKFNEEDVKNVCKVNKVKYISDFS